MKNLTKAFSLVLFFGILQSPLIGHAEVKIGFVSTERIVKEAGSAKLAEKKLVAEFSKREKELFDLSSEIKSESVKLDKEALTLSESIRAVRQKRLLELERDFQRKRRAFQEDLNVRKNEEMQKLLERANKVIKDVAIKDKFDIIFQDAVYASPSLDITTKVLEALKANP